MVGLRLPPKKGCWFVRFPIDFLMILRTLAKFKALTNHTIMYENHYHYNMMSCDNRMIIQEVPNNH